MYKHTILSIYSIIISVQQIITGIYNVGCACLRMLNHPAAAWIILIVSTILTAIAWSISNQAMLARAADRFKFESTDIKNAINRRMLEYESVLRGGVGFFQANHGHVSRDQWHIYVNTLNIDRYFPGIQGIGHSLVVQPEDVEVHNNAIRSQGFHNYRIYPEGNRAVYTAIIYLEPFDFRNQRAFGYDMFSNPVRRLAMERARDTGLMAVSGMVTLVQETETDIQQGFLMYLPLYTENSPLETVAERRNSWYGVVYSPFRIKDLMQGILGVGMADVGFEIFDGKSINSEHLLYKSDTNAVFSNPKPDFLTTEPLVFGGHTWTLRLFSYPSYISPVESGQPMLVAIGGMVVDLLLFVIIGSISRQQKRAEELAKAMTTELSKSKDILAEKNAALKLYNEELRQFAYIASHDLNEPLDVIQPYLQLLNSHYREQLDKDANEFIDFIQESVQNMKEMTRDMLIYAKIGSKPGDYVITALDIPLNIALANIQERISATGTIISKDPLPAAYIDCHLIEFVFTNILDNAIKYAQKNVVPRVHIGVEVTSNECVISISDNGIGFDPGLTGQIFLMFKKLHAKDTYPGTGAGLAICKHIIEQHGGRIWVKTQSGSGSTFFFTLRLHKLEAA